MRKLFAIVAAMLLSVATFAQAPQGFSYQAVVRDAQNAIVANQSVKVSITILQGADLDSATEVYSEQHNVKTNQNGLFTLVVGKGDSAGSFRTVNWSKGNYYIRTKTDYGESTSQLMSVPYALFAENVAPDNIVNVLNNSEVTNKLNFVSKTDIDNFVTSADVTATVNTALASYATTENVNSALANYATTENVNTTVNNSLANYTTAQKLKDTLNAYSTTQKLKDTLAVYAKAEAIPTVPTNVGDFTNNMNYVTQAEIDSRGYLTVGDAGNIELADYYSKTDIDNKVDNFAETMLSGEYWQKDEIDGPHEYVDLGLPSGTLWATCNVGASQPEEVGSYFAWGETEEKDDYSTTTWTEPVGGETLSATDDAATVHFGGLWAVPTEAQWRELLDNCFFVKYGTSSKKNSYIVYKAKNDSDKGKIQSDSYTPVAQYSQTTDPYIFLPATGFKQGTALNDANTVVYWVNERVFWRVNRYKVMMGRQIYTESGTGYHGAAIRPVRANKNVAKAADLNNYYTKTEGDERYVLKTDAYTKAESDNKYALKTETPTKLSDLTADKIGDMPLVTVKLIIQNDSYSGAGTVKFMGHEYVITESDHTDIEETFKLPAYSPVFMSVTLNNTGQTAYRYKLHLNGKSLKMYEQNDMVNEIVGPFPNAENTIQVVFLEMTN